MGLVTVARAQSEPTFSALTSARITELIDAASAVCESFCGRAFGNAARTEVRDGNGEAELFLRVTPVTALTLITISDDFGNSDVFDSSDVRYDVDTGRMTFRMSSTQGVFTTGQQNISIVYTGGYTTIPADVQAACILVMRGIYAMSADTGNPGMKSENIGDYSYTRQDDNDCNALVIPGSARALLAPYRFLLYA